MRYSPNRICQGVPGPTRQRRRHAAIHQRPHYFAYRLTHPATVPGSTPTSAAIFEYDSPAARRAFASIATAILICTG